MQQLPEYLEDISKLQIQEVGAGTTGLESAFATVGYVLIVVFMFYGFFIVLGLFKRLVVTKSFKDPFEEVQPTYVMPAQPQPVNNQPPSNAVMLDDPTNVEKSDDSSPKDEPQIKSPNLDIPTFKRLGVNVSDYEPPTIDASKPSEDGDKAPA